MSWVILHIWESCFDIFMFLTFCLNLSIDKVFLSIRLCFNMISKCKFSLEDPNVTVSVGMVIFSERVTDPLPPATDMKNLLLKIHFLSITSLPLVSLIYQLLGFFNKNVSIVFWDFDWFFKKSRHLHVDCLVLMLLIFL